MRGSMEASVSSLAISTDACFRGCSTAAKRDQHSVGPNFDHLRLFYIVNHHFLLLMWVHASMEHRVDKVGGMAREHASDVEVVHYYIYSFVTRHLFLHSLNTHTRTSTPLQT